MFVHGALAFTWDLAPTFEILGLTVRYYSVWFAALFVFGYVPARWQFARGGMKSSDVDYLVLASLVGVLVGGRLAHVVFYDFASFVDSPEILLDFSRGGLASHGSAAGFLLAVWALARLRERPFLEVTDRLVISAMIGAACVRFGNFFNSEIVGRPTGADWGVRFPLFDGVANAPLRHPSQLYEAALCLSVVALLLVVDRRLGEERPLGLLSFVTLVAYFGGRFMLEFFKEYQALSPEGIWRMGHVLSAPAALIGVVGLVWVLGKAGTGDPGHAPG